MTSTADFEEMLCNFTFSRTGEKVYLDLSHENKVILRPLCSRGSMSLAAFWVKLLQHSNNYPVYAHPYKKLYTTGHNFQLQLHLNGLSITIDLVSGQMIIKGPHVIDWFVKTFPDIMQGYSNPVQHVSEKVCRKYNAEEVLALKYEREQMYKNYYEKWPIHVLEKTVEVMKAGKDDPYYESVSADGFLDGVDLETHSPIADLLNTTDIKEQLDRLSKGKVIQGLVLYRLWKSTLKLWFSDEEAKVFIVTPHIDTDRLTDICTLFLQHKLTACIDTMCIPISSLYDTFAEVRGNTIKRFPPQSQVVIEYKIYSSVVYPIKDFTTSFIAMLKGGVVSILQTNTNFDKNNFITLKCTTAEFSILDEATFYQSFLNRILV